MKRLLPDQCTYQVNETFGKKGTVSAVMEQLDFVRNCATFLSNNDRLAFLLCTTLLSNHIVSFCIQTFIRLPENHTITWKKVHLLRHSIVPKVVHSAVRSLSLDWSNSWNWMISNLFPNLCSLLLCCDGPIQFQNLQFCNKLQRLTIYSRWLDPQDIKSEELPSCLKELHLEGEFEIWSLPGHLTTLCHTQLLYKVEKDPQTMMRFHEFIFPTSLVHLKGTVRDLKIEKLYPCEQLRIFEVSSQWFQPTAAAIISSRLTHLRSKMNQFLVNHMKNVQFLSIDAMLELTLDLSSLPHLRELECRFDTAPKRSITLPSSLVTLHTSLELMEAFNGVENVKSLHMRVSRQRQKYYNKHPGCLKWYARDMFFLKRLMSTCPLLRIHFECLDFIEWFKFAYPDWVPNDEIKSSGRWFRNPSFVLNASSSSEYQLTVCCSRCSLLQTHGTPECANNNYIQYEILCERCQSIYKNEYTLQHSYTTIRHIGTCHSD